MYSHSQTKHRPRQLLIKTISVVTALTLALQLGFGVLPAWAEEPVLPQEEQGLNPSTEEAVEQSDSEQTTEQGAEQDAEQNADTDDPAADAALSEGAFAPLALDLLGFNTLEAPYLGYQPLGDTAWYGNGTASSYTISLPADLAGLADIVNAGTDDFTGKTVTLANGFTGQSFVPIGTAEHPFNGTFDGGGKNLTNITINPGNAKTHIGLFGAAGPASVLKNINLNLGTVTVDEPSESGATIQYVGAIVGYSEGSIQNCTSSMAVTITSVRKLTLVADGEKFPADYGSIREIGGIAGVLLGSISNTNHSGAVTVTSPVNVTEENKYVAGNIGGLIGLHGSPTDLTSVQSIVNCNNTGALTVTTSGAGGKDRFGEDMYSVSANVGGIAGSSYGSIEGCRNSGGVQTSTGTLADPGKGHGAASSGGIVGNLRGRVFDLSAKDWPELREGDDEYDEYTYDSAYLYFKTNGGVASAPASYPVTVTVKDCYNSGTVVGVSVVGGIVGRAASFSLIEGCGNTGDVKGCRWNKPFSGGIAGQAAGDIRYCYNRGDIYSVVGAGYYCCGIAGAFQNVYAATFEDNDIPPNTEMTGCYVTGKVYTEAAGYRACVFAGENRGFIHGNTYLANLTLDSILTFVNNGSVIDNLLCTDAEIRGSKGIATLNGYAAGPGEWGIFFVPDTANTNGGYPILSRNIQAGGSTAISSVASSPVKKSDATYSVAMNPVPTFTVTPATLLQNADYYIVPQANSAGQIGGPFTASIYGMGKYSGLLGTVQYNIVKGAINQCTIVAGSKPFNWEVQEPSSVKLIDPAGLEVDPSEYTWETLNNGTGDTNHIGGKWYDYIYVHADKYKYDIKVTANPTSNYVGETTQAAFRIDFINLQDLNLVKGDSIIWNGETIAENYESAIADKLETKIEVVYTGTPIKPTINSLKYKDRELRNGTGVNYWSAPNDYDFKYIYGNPHPETNGDADLSLQGNLNVSTADAPACMTMRFTTGGSFTNYVNIFFKIVPADVDSLVTAQPIAKQQVGATPFVLLTYNGMVLLNGRDYDLSYADNTAPGTGKVLVTGKGNYSGTKVVTFEIEGSGGSGFGAPGSGDINGDGLVTINEAILVLRYIAGLETGLTPGQIAAANMDGDAVLTIGDAILMLRKIAGL
jgi:hypothetical protein